MYLALGVTTATYILIAVGVFGTLTVDEVVGYGETAIAEAARPALGDAGFTIMAIAALLATASSVNATLYASGGLTAMLAEVGQFPPFFGRGSPLGSHSGLLITGGLVLVVANLVDLSAIASVGSACSLLIFLMVGLAAYRLRTETGSVAAIVLLGIAATATVLVFFAADTLRNAPETFSAIIAIAVLAVVLDFVWKRMRPSEPTPELTPSPRSAIASYHRDMALARPRARADRRLSEAALRRRAARSRSWERGPSSPSARARARSCAPRCATCRSPGTTASSESPRRLRALAGACGSSPSSSWPACGRC